MKHCVINNNSFCNEQSLNNNICDFYQIHIYIFVNYLYLDKQQIKLQLKDTFFQNLQYCQQEFQAVVHSYQYVTFRKLELVLFYNSVH